MTFEKVEGKLLAVEEQQDGSVLVNDLEDHQDDGANQEGGAKDGQAASGDRGSGDQGADDHVNDGNLSGDEREAIRERRRQERANKKVAARQREDGLKEALSQRDRVINEMRERLLQVEQRGVAADAAQIDVAINRAKNATSYFKGIIEEATNKKDGATVADATQRMVQAEREADRLTDVKKTFVNHAQTSNQPALDASVKANAEDWVTNNSWYDPSGKDEDSAIVLTIDRRLAGEGYDPRQKSYWEELDKRVKKYLPQKAQESGHNADNSSQERPARTPVAGSGREGGAGGSRQGGTTYQLSAARVQALKDAGTWDDPKSRSDAIRRYRDYDRQHAARG